MASITSTGVGSGLDVSTIVTSLMTLEKRPLTLMQNQASKMQTRLSAFGTLKSQLASLGDVASRLAGSDAWNPLRVDSGNSDAASATVKTTATAGKHSLRIDQLAQPQVLASNYYATSGATVGTGSLTLDVGTTSGAGVFTPKSGSTAVTITIDSAHQTLAGVRDAINAAKAGVSASIVNGTGGARLVLRSADGADSSIRLTATDNDGNATDAAGLSALAWDPAAASGAGRNLNQTQGAQDALFQLDGMDLTSASNTPADVLDGVTFNFKKVTTEAFSLNVSVETVAVRKNVNDFVNSYNAVTKLLQSQTQADPSGKANGALQADSTAVSLLSGMRAMLRGAVSGLTAPNSLSAAGIELQRDGTLLVVESRFAAQLDNPTQLAKLFNQAGTGDARGFGVRFKEWATTFTSETGALASRIDGIKHSVDINQKKQDSEQERLDRTEARLRASYQRLDTQMSALQARMNQMTASLGLNT